MVSDLERLFGWSPDPEHGKWFASKTKDSFVRFWDADIREVLYKLGDRWVVAIAQGKRDKFHVLPGKFETTRQAKDHMAKRDMFELDDIEEVLRSWRKQ